MTGVQTCALPICFPVTILAISEFEEVGEAIRTFTSDDATVIIGTVIDPSLNDELRVTLVATGLGQSLSSAHSSYRKQDEIKQNVINNTQNAKPSTIQADHSADYFDIPTFLRRRAQ